MNTPKWRPDLPHNALPSSSVNMVRHPFKRADKTIGSDEGHTGKIQPGRTNRPTANHNHAGPASSAGSADSPAKRQETDEMTYLRSLSGT